MKLGDKEVEVKGKELDLVESFFVYLGNRGRERKAKRMNLAFENP